MGHRFFICLLGLIEEEVINVLWSLSTPSINYAQQPVTSFFDLLLTRATLLLSAIIKPFDNADDGEDVVRILLVN